MSGACYRGSIPLKSVNVNAVYAGKILPITVDVVPPRVVSLTLAPDTVTSGDNSIATVVLNLPSLAGPVVVDLICADPGFATVPAQVTIPQDQSSAKFTITTPAIETAFKTAYAVIYAVYSGSSASAMLTVKSKVVAGILNSLTLFPATVTDGFSTRGTITLIETVPTATVVALAAMDAAAGGPGHLPLPGNSSSVASVPTSITIPAGQTAGQFTITTKHTLLPGTQRHLTIMAGAIVFKYAALTVTA